MSTLTAFLGLKKPAVSGELVSVADINTNSDKIDAKALNHDTRIGNAEEALATATGITFWKNYTPVILSYSGTPLGGGISRSGKVFKIGDLVFFYILMEGPFTGVGVVTDPTLQVTLPYASLSPNNVSVQMQVTTSAADVFNYFPEYESNSNNVVLRPMKSTGATAPLASDKTTDINLAGIYLIRINGWYRSNGAASILTLTSE